MYLKEIVNRPNEMPIEQDEALFVIKEYIKARKGVDTNPKVETKLGTFHTMIELDLMIDMLNYAVGWFRIEMN